MLFFRYLRERRALRIGDYALSVMRFNLLLCAIGLAVVPVAFAAEAITGGISALCVEADTGKVLFEMNADVVRPPASMVKMMQFLLVSEGIQRGDWTLNTPIKASRRARGMGGTQVFLEDGEVWELGRLMQAVAVASANDAAMAVAEGLWGSAEAYLRRSNERARELGMGKSEFHSVHGLPPGKGQEPDRTTARDMAVLARKCAEDPRILAWTSQESMVFRPGEKPYFNTNKLLRRMDDCDGLKTGYIRAAGFCVTATAKRCGKRLIAVVMGHTSANGRFTMARKLLDDAFASFDAEPADLAP